jgi:hypothetical protein
VSCTRLGEAAEDSPSYSASGTGGKAERNFRATKGGARIQPDAKGDTRMQFKVLFLPRAAFGAHGWGDGFPGVPLTLHPRLPSFRLFEAPRKIPNRIQPSLFRVHPGMPAPMLMDAPRVSLPRAHPGMYSEYESDGRHVSAVIELKRYPRPRAFASSRLCVRDFNANRTEELPPDCRKPSPTTCIFIALPQSIAFSQSISLPNKYRSLKPSVESPHPLRCSPRGPLLLQRVRCYRT